MSLPLRELPAELARELRSRKRLVFVLFAVVMLGSTAAALRDSPEFVSRAVIALDAGTPTAKYGPATIDGPSRVLQAIDHLALPRLAVEATQLAGEDPHAEAVDLAVERVRNNLSAAVDVSGRILLEYRDDNPETAFHVLHYITQGLAAPVPESDEGNRTGQPASRQVTPSPADASQRGTKERFDAGQKALRDLEQRIAERRERIRQLEPRESRAREAAPAELLAVTRERAEELQATIAELDQQRETLLLRRRELDITQRDSATSLALGAQVDALAEKKRGLAVNLANILAQLEKLEGFSEEAGALAAALDKDRKALFDLLARREALQGALRPSQEAENAAAKRQLQTTETDSAAKVTVDLRGIQLYEPATPPVAVATFDVRQRMAASLAAGIMTPLLVLALFCLFDPRVRSAVRLEARTGLPVLMDIPVVATPLEKRRESRRLVWLLLMAVAVVVLHGTVSATLAQGGG